MCEHGEKADYALTVGITGAATDDAKVPRTSYHATGELPCSMGDAAPAGAEVRRRHRELRWRCDGEGHQGRRHVVRGGQRPRALPGSRGSDLWWPIVRSARTRNCVEIVSGRIST